MTDVEVLGHYRLRLTFSDGLTGDVDLSHVRDWAGVFAPLRDPDVFAQVRVDPEIGTITWPNGADLAPEVLHARASAHPVRRSHRAHPGPRFDEGSMTALDLPDGALGGIVALYSIIHIPPERLPGVFAEFGRVLAPGGHLLLAFQVGDERRHLAEWFGHAVSLDGYRWPPDRVAEMLSQAGLVVRARLLREPDEAVETTQRAYLLARRPADIRRS